MQAELPTAVVTAAELDDPAGLSIPKLLVLAGLCKTNSDGRRLIQGGAVSIDDVKVTDVNAKITRENFADGSFVLRAGKKNFRRVVLEQ